MKRISILGSTGSIGTNSLDVIGQQQGAFSVAYLSTNRNVELLLQQAARFRPRAVAVVEHDGIEAYAEEFAALGVELLRGFDGLLELSSRDDTDIVINALVGAVGMQPTLNAIKCGHRIALANKETLVLGGELVMSQVAACGAELVPIDSEHSAILQCLAGERRQDVARLILTASGGPFRQTSDLRDVTVAQALNHPNWDMGPKITIDSATLMNKGLEVIEACWLFGMPPSSIDIVVHPQSIVHSLVEFVDGSLKAQLGLPDMRIPIQYALSYPERMRTELPRLDLAGLQELTFEPPDLNKFRCLKLAFEALEAGGAAPAVLNASNEETVSLFLAERIRFDQIPDFVEGALNDCGANGYQGVEELLHYDSMARAYVREKCSLS